MKNGKTLERLVLQDRVHIQPEEALNRISTFVEQCRGMEGIIIVGHEGDLKTFTCRPTRNLPSYKIADVVRTAINKSDEASDMEDPLAPLIEIPGMRSLSLRETAQRIRGFVNQCPGMTLILLLCRDSNIDNLKRLHSSNLQPGAMREMLRNALIAYNKNSLPPPMA